MSNIALTANEHPGGPDLSRSTSVLPIYSASRQTNHMRDAAGRDAARTRRMLYAFVFVLTMAVACALVLLVSVSTAHAFASTAANLAASGPGTTTAAGFGIVASLGAAFTVMKLALQARRRSSIQSI